MNRAAPRSSLAGAALLGSALVHAAAFIAFGPFAANGARMSDSPPGPRVMHVAIAPWPAREQPVPQEERSERQATRRPAASPVSPAPPLDRNAQAPALDSVRADGLPRPPASEDDGVPSAIQAPAVVALAPSHPAMRPATPPAAIPARYLHAPEPAYPASAREEGEEGVVLLRVRISRSGAPEEIVLERTSGFRELDRAAIAGVKRWTFTPALRGAEPIEAWMQVPIRFRLG